MKPENRAAYALGVVCLLLMGSIIFQVVINAANNRQDANIRESQYRACIVNGNALREQVRQEFVDLKRQSLIPTYEGIAQTIPEGAPAREILEAQVAYLKERIATIKERIPDVRCLQVYPPIDGQVYPHIDKPPLKLKGPHPRERRNVPQAPRRPDTASESAPVAPSSPTPSPSPSAPSAPSQTPVAPQGEPGPQGPAGPSGNDGQDAPPTPSQPPAQPEQPGLLDPVTDPVCELSGVCL